MLGNISLYLVWVDYGSPCPDQYSAVICDHFLSKEETTDSLDMAACIIFYTNPWFRTVSADRTGFPKEQNV